MMLNDISLLVTLLLLVAFSAFFTGAEVALMGLSRYRAQQWSASPTPPGRALAWLLTHPALMLGTILIAITATNYVAEAIATEWVINRLGREYIWVAIVGMAVIIILFAEIVPILYASANSDRVARIVAMPVRLTASVLAAPVWFISALGRFLGGSEWHRVGFVTVEELKALVSAESEQAELEEEEKEMLHSIFEFADKVARDIMRPLAEVISVPYTATILNTARTAIPRRLSRLPVYRGTPDRIIGVAFAKDLLLPLKAGRGDRSVTEVMRTPYAVPAGAKLSELLDEFRRRKQTLAIVVDEQGRALGLFTMEDLLEEIVGDIFDEYDLVIPAVERIGDSIIVDGRMSLGDVSELLGAELPEGRYTTIAGLLLNRLGTIPREGESAEVDDFTLTSERMDSDRIARVRISPSRTAQDLGEPHLPVGGPTHD